VERGIAERLKNDASIQFSPMAAAYVARGTIVVCGYISVVTKQGTFDADVAYRGILSGGRFRVNAFGPNEERRATVRSDCAERGVVLPPIEQPTPPPEGVPLTGTSSPAETPAAPEAPAAPGIPPPG
jgi:hypothetical protein